ncbi:MAG: hypothetical protein WCP93_00830 [Candidatus Berkelbacteria bacterium]
MDDIVKEVTDKLSKSGFVATELEKLVLESYNFHLMRGFIAETGWPKLGDMAMCTDTYMFGTIKINKIHFQPGWLHDDTAGFVGHLIELIIFVNNLKNHKYSIDENQDIININKRLLCDLQNWLNGESKRKFRWDYHLEQLNQTNNEEIKLPY